MKNERLYTDEQLKSITLEQIAIDAEKWPRKQVEQFFERQGLERNPDASWEESKKWMSICWDEQGIMRYNRFSVVYANETELTLPDALRWEELQKGELKVGNPFSLISDFARKASEACQTVSEAKALRDENEKLRAKIAQLESEKESEEEDRRFDFGSMVTFTRDSDNETFIGAYLAKPGDFNKILIAGEGYKWQIHENYFEGRNAVSLVKTDGK